MAGGLRSQGGKLVFVGEPATHFFEGTVWLKAPAIHSVGFRGCLLWRLGDIAATKMDVSRQDLNAVFVVQKNLGS